MIKPWQIITLSVLVALLGFRLLSLRPAPPAIVPVEAGAQIQAVDDGSPAAEAATPRVLVPEDPAKYGMVVIPPNAPQPQSEIEWERYIRSGIEQNKVLDTPQAKEVLDQAKMDREKFQKNVSKVDEHIAKLEKEKEGKPFDDAINKRLNTLYKLKAASNILAEKVIIQ